jgi:titin
VGNVIQGNRIGTDVTGTVALGNLDGVKIEHYVKDSVIGGSAAGAGNVISGNTRYGITVDTLVNAPATGTLVEGNLIGVEADGVSPLGNGSHGCYIDSEAVTIGGTAAGAGNVIAYNGDDGVFVRGNDSWDRYNAILGNSIFANGGLGIDLGPTNGVTANDAGDGDTGANELQNYPVLTAASASAVIDGTLNSAADTTYRLEFFYTAAGDATGYGEGEIFIGAQDVTTDAGGNVGFTIDLSTAIPVGSYVSATATDPNGNTSEFSQCVVVP